MSEVVRIFTIVSAIIAKNQGGYFEKRINDKDSSS